MCSSTQQDDEPLFRSIPATDISKELSKFTTPRLRLTQSGPLRHGAGALSDLRQASIRFVLFYHSVFGVISVRNLILGITVLAYGLQQYAGRAALYAGARLNAAIIQHGQYHRLVTPIFLHGSPMHLLSNCYSLWRIGPLAESAFGRDRFALIYILSGIGGNLLGLWKGSARSISVGASGAVFGILGATGTYALRNRPTLGRGADALMQNVGTILLLNLVFGLSPRSGVDNLGHVGGFATGAFLGLVLAPSLKAPHADDDAGWRGGRLAVRALLAAVLAATALSVRDGVVLTQGLMARAAMGR